MRYEGRLYRPPSEADALIVQATIGCSWNHCTYCDMYRDKTFRVRPLADTLADLDVAAASFGDQVEKLFVADGDALCLPTESWTALLERARTSFPKLRRVSSYAMARNVLAKTDAELRSLAEAGLRLLRELRTMIAEARPRSAVFRTNHASNYLPLAGVLPRDRDRILAAIDGALDGHIPLRREWQRGL